MIMLVSSIAFQMPAQIDPKMQLAVCQSQIETFKGLMSKQQLTIDEKDKLLLIAEEVIQLRKAKLQPAAKSVSALKKYAKIGTVGGFATLATGFLAGMNLLSNTKVSRVMKDDIGRYGNVRINEFFRLKIKSSVLRRAQWFSGLVATVSGLYGLRLLYKVTCLNPKVSDIWMRLK